MRRFLASRVLGNNILICGEEANHMRNAVRMSVGDSFIAIVGGVPVTLGRRIMRTETAGIAVPAACFYAKGQMEY